MNASTEAAKDGYTMYRHKQGKVTRAEINRRLMKMGYSEGISDRMFRHYGNLARVGLTYYVPINRFDVLRAKEGGIR